MDVQGEGDVQVGEEDEDGDQVMSQEELQTSMEEEYGWTELEITVCMTEAEGVHTPGPDKRRCTDETQNIMKVLHTPLLGPT